MEPEIGEDGRSYRFRVRVGAPPAGAKKGTKISRGSFRCLFSGTPLKYAYVDDEANARRMGSRLMAVVAAGRRMRVYLSPTDEMHEVAASARPWWKPSLPSRGTWASNAQGRRYGFRTFGDYFTPRQLVALTTFSDLVGEARERVRRDAVAAGLRDDGVPLRDGGVGATAYAEAVSVYLAFAVDKCADHWNGIASWRPRGTVRPLFARQAIPMMWDFAEAGPLSDAHCGWTTILSWTAMGLKSVYGDRPGCATATDATTGDGFSSARVFSTDPPYYDNIGYADLSDFFYVWLRRTSRSLFPDLFSTLGTPKADELVATTYRHGSRQKAETFFLVGMTSFVRRLVSLSHPHFPVTVYYAFKQSERKSTTGVSSTGWETFLAAVIRSGFSLTGTWPMRTESKTRLGGIGTNALASSIIMVCRRRPEDAPEGTRREFVTELRAELPPALRLLQSGSIVPMDLQQAAIGPGMAVYTRYETLGREAIVRSSARWALRVGGVTTGRGRIPRRGPPGSRRNSRSGGTAQARLQVTPRSGAPGLGHAPRRMAAA